MKCEDFKKHIADLCDKSVDATIKADCMRHIEECASCRAYYKEFMHTVDLLTPQHAPQPHRNKRQFMLKRLLQVAAVILVFLAGVGVGLSNLFSTRAEASPSIAELFDQCIRHSREAKGFSMWAYVRTDPQENFAFIDPEAELLKVRVSLLKQGGNSIWRIEKEGGRTIVGDNCLLMAYCHVAHDCTIGNHVIMSNATQVGGEVTIDDYAILSGGTLVHQFSHIGAHVMIQGGSRVNKDVPPYVKAGRDPLSYAGINSIGLRRRSFTNEQINDIQNIYRYVYLSGMNTSHALERIEAELPATKERDEILLFIRNSPRGIIKGYFE